MFKLPYVTADALAEETRKRVPPGGLRDALIESQQMMAEASARRMCRPLGVNDPEPPDMNPVTWTDMGMPEREQHKEELKDG